MSLIPGGFGFGDEVFHDVNPSMGLRGFDDNKRLLNSLLRLDNSLAGQGRTRDSRWNSILSPPIDVFDHKDYYGIHISLPGVSPDEINLDYDSERNQLVVRGEIKRTEKKLSENLRINERRTGSFSRRINLPGLTKVKEEGITAELNNGVLEVSLPKIVEGTKTLRRINIKGSKNEGRISSVESGNET
ncbi:HSP20-like chaperone [Nadsonia fulvescens var. elongata DSM 6958]|uniref:HSP20-like chaperone n=1 Tax=Nadsonia fulvescens var. elongata DSM 6958 TaxID=857566 RepID=A0A1E3PM61_9ASCO|nr:HSP20-like chaperone [Nadsonia fulvescens var. elongata DSM 6958]